MLGMIQPWQSMVLVFLALLFQAVGKPTGATKRNCACCHGVSASATPGQAANALAAGNLPKLRPGGDYRSQFEFMGLERRRKLARAAGDDQESHEVIEGVSRRGNHAIAGPFAVG